MPLKFCKNIAVHADERTRLTKHNACWRPAACSNEGRRAADRTGRRAWRQPRTPQQSAASSAARPLRNHASYSNSFVPAFLVLEKDEQPPPPFCRKISSWFCCKSNAGKMSVTEIEIEQACILWCWWLQKSAAYQLDNGIQTQWSPLAAKILGCLLNSKRDSSTWNRILASSIYNIEQ